MRLLVDIDTVTTNLNLLTTSIEDFNSAVSAFGGASINCTLEEVSGILDDYKKSISTDLDKLNTSSNEYSQLVEECCNGYRSNEENVQSLSIEELEKIISDNPDVTVNYQGNASTKLTGLPNTDLGPMINGSLVQNGDYMLLNFNEDEISSVFGSQLDNNGSSGYGYDSVGCDDYARGYCIYIQTGGKVVPSKASVGSGDSKSGLNSKQISASNRKEQAELAYDLLQEGKPSVIHINSPSTGSGKGHWVTVVGVKKGVTRENVKVDDLVIVDPVTGTIRSTTEDKEYLRTDTGRCSYEPGYHINYYA